MPVNTTAYLQITNELSSTKTTLVAVSKTKPNEDLISLYELGQRDFGENYVQELVDKAASLPKDIRWHFIGHLQSNKVKYIAPFVHLIHGVDSLKLLQEINKQAIKNNRVIDCLLQIHIAEEETKFGLDESELGQIIIQIDQLPNVRICGLMGMASFSEDEHKVRNEFNYLNSLFTQHKSWFLAHTGKEPILSMGMSGDYALAIKEGSTLVRIGSLLFGARNYA
ncbi:YggS family pyridoxal phosphate-dependent enzyme [Sediminibacterium sp.]|uniref:YggS family pyridoxal phosphate-dependent enzyme n=1 Tax=Sediminibacterium sp. TaxID=1917865 RepID=UPI003F705A32